MTNGPERIGLEVKLLQDSPRSLSSARYASVTLPTTSAEFLAATPSWSKTSSARNLHKPAAVNKAGHGKTCPGSQSNTVWVPAVLSATFH